MRSVQRLIVFMALVWMSVSTAPAEQRDPLIGTWSTQTSTQGQYTGNIFTTFNADGQFSQRWIVRGATVDYVGSYALSSDRNAIQWTYRDYNPKTVPPMIQLNTAFTTYIRWVSDNLFITEDGGGMNRWVRQPQ
jgi:hypothetical protein